MRKGKSGAGEMSSISDMTAGSAGPDAVANMPCLGLVAYVQQQPKVAERNKELFLVPQRGHLGQLKLCSMSASLRSTAVGKLPILVEEREMLVWQPAPTLRASTPT